MNSSDFAAHLSAPVEICRIVDFAPGIDRLFPFDFTGAAAEPDTETVTDTKRFSAWINGTLEEERCRYGIGGYAENRVLYQSKALFEASEEPRSLHLGVDIWGPAGNPVYAPLKGSVHSFAFNDNAGDYGATIILRHAVPGLTFYTLYGHLSLADIRQIRVGDSIPAGAHFAAFGAEIENGHWPPHLHFQVILDMQEKDGDYPGVCKPSEQRHWLANSPDPAVLLRTTFINDKDKEWYN